MTQDPCGLLRTDNSLPLQTLRQILAPEQLHRNKRSSLIDTVIDDLHDVGAPNHGSRLRLASKAVYGLRRFRNYRINELYRNLSAKVEILGKPDRAHPARTKLTNESIARCENQTLGHETEEVSRLAFNSDRVAEPTGAQKCLVSRTPSLVRTS